MYFPNREELSFRVVLAFPNASIIGFVARICSSVSLMPLLVPTSDCVSVSFDTASRVKVVYLSPSGTSRIIDRSKVSHNVFGRDGLSSSTVGVASVSATDGGRIAGGDYLSPLTIMVWLRPGSPDVPTMQR